MELNIVEFIKYTGAAGVIAVIWYVYHKSVSKQLQTIIEQQEKRETQNNQNLNKIIDLQATREQENFKLLKEMIDLNLLQNEKLQDIKNSIANNNWCPLWRNITKGGTIQDIIERKISDECSNTTS